MDYDSIFIAKVVYSNGKQINKTFPSRLEWILQGVISVDFHYYTLKGFSKKPFNLSINSYDSSNNNSLIVILSICSLIIFCILILFIILKFSKKNYLSRRNLSQMNNYIVNE